MKTKPIFFSKNRLQSTGFCDCRFITIHECNKQIKCPVSFYQLFHVEQMKKTKQNHKWTENGSIAWIPISYA